MWFKRSDGQLFSALEGNADFKLMTRDGSFELIGEELPFETPDDSAQTSNETATTFPENFPGKAKQVFEKLGKSFAEVGAMTRDELIDVKGIAAKTADAIIALREENTTE